MIYIVSKNPGSIYLLKLNIIKPRRTELIYLLITILSIGLQWYTHGFGLLKTHDSYQYLSAAHSLSTSHSLVDQNGHHFLFWPPLFPIILSAIPNAEQTLVWVNMLITLSIAVVVYLLIKRFIKNLILAILCFVQIMLSVHLLLISTFLWSELIFLFLTVLFIHQLLQKPVSALSFYIAIGLGFLLCLQRNAGFFIVTGGAIWTWVSEIQSNKKYLNALLLLTGGTSGGLVWNIYVWTSFPHHHIGLSNELFQYAYHNLQVLLAATVNLVLPVPVFTILIFTILALLIVLVLKNELRSKAPIQLLLLLSATYFLFFGLVLTINITGSKIDIGEGDRFISVISPFLHMLIFKSTEVICAKFNPKFRLVVYIVICCWMSYPIVRTVRNAHQWHLVSLKKYSQSLD